MLGRSTLPQKADFFKPPARPQTALRHSTMIPPDVRAYSQALLTTMPSQLLVPYLHPVFYSLHNMPKEVCVPCSHRLPAAVNRN